MRLTGSVACMYKALMRKLEDERPFGDVTGG
jgi:hypothetical protein